MTPSKCSVTGIMGWFGPINDVSMETECPESHGFNHLEVTGTDLQTVAKLKQNAVIPRNDNYQ